MTGKIAQSLSARVWALARRQHWVVTREQLLALGMTPAAIDHRLAIGRLHRIYRGVYAVGRPQLTRESRWMAALLSCGPAAVLSHRSAAVLWGVLEKEGPKIEISLPLPLGRKRDDITLHRRMATAFVSTRELGIPVTTPAQTLVDLGCELRPRELEAAVNEADKRNLISFDRLRDALDERRGQRGARALRSLLDRRTFALTESELERRFLPIARRAGLSRPETGCTVDGFKVDFYWPRLGLVVETDGLRYHRTPAQQARDRLRDQAHTAAGHTCLRFTHAQVYYEPEHVEATLVAVVRRLRSSD